MRFEDREAEALVLEDAYARKQSSLVAIYGRRRLGKTELITRFVAKEGGVYYLSTKEGGPGQLKSLASLIGLKLGDKELTRFGAVDWEALFMRMQNRPEKKRLVVAIDEFPYLVRSNGAISSIFQKGWDVYLKNANVVLILCGSSISMMHSEVLDYAAPLFQRSTTVLELKPLEMPYALLLLLPMVFEDRVTAYFIFGGVPAYYSYVEGSKNIRDVVRAIFKPGSVFLDEPSTLLSEETRSETRYLDVLDLIANGVNRTNEIASKVGMQASNITRYLDVLERLRLVRKAFPVTEKPVRRSKKGVYEIADNYLRFWFRHVKQNRELLSVDGADSVAERVTKELGPTSGIAFEDFSREFVSSLSGKAFPKITKVGRWWGGDPAKPKGTSQEEIDLVAINDDTKDILFAECKWSNSKTDVDTYLGLKRKAALVQWNGGIRREHFAIFSKSGFTERLKGMAERDGTMLLDLDVMEKSLSALRH